jgi:hypothetical protein
MPDQPFSHLASAVSVLSPRIVTRTPRGYHLARDERARLDPPPGRAPAWAFRRERSTIVEGAKFSGNTMGEYFKKTFGS